MRSRSEGRSGIEIAEGDVARSLSYWSIIIHILPF